MADSAFLKTLQQRLFPILRAEGFKGTNPTLRRYRPPILHVFNIQRSTSGGHCYLNLGAHLDFLPTAGEGRCDPATIRESECVFRDRMEPPPGREFGWVYQVGLAAIDESVSFVISEWAQVGHRFFARYSNFPDQFVALVRSAVEMPPHPMEALVLARIAAHLGLDAEARSLVEAALPSVSAAATGLKRNLERVVASR